MSKVWEETWAVFEANKGFPAFAATIGPYEVRVFESMSGEDDDIARARLAAAAPEMARLLMRLLEIRDFDDATDCRAAAREVLKKAGMIAS